MPYFNNKIFISAIAYLTANSPWVDAGNILAPNTYISRRLDVEADMGECAGKLYDLSLIVNGESRHVSLIAKPSSAEDCPWILYEASSMRLEEVQLEKQSYIINADQDIEGLGLGSFTFTTLHDAFENALIDTSSPYHVVSNNCASLPVKMMGILDLDPADPKVVAYAADKLSSSSGDLNLSTAEMQMIADAMDAYGVVEEFVSASIHAQL